MIHSIALALLVLPGCSNDSAAKAPCDNRLSVTSPSAGAWIESDSVQVEGRACDVEFVEIQGTRIVPRSDGFFSTTLDLSEGIVTIEVVGLDGDTPVAMERFSVLHGTFGQQGTPLSNLLHAHLSQAGIDTLADAVMGIFEPAEISTMLAGMNPLVQEPLDFGIVLDTEVHVDTINFSSASLGLELKENRIGVSLRVVDLHLWGRLYAYYGGSAFYEEQLDAYADLTVVSGYLEPSLREGALHLEATEVETRLEGFGFDVTDFPGWIEDNVLAGTVQDLLENAAIESVQTLLVPQIEDALESLAISESVTILDAAIDLSASPAAFEVTTTGLDLVFDITVSGPGGAHSPPEGPFMAPTTSTSLAENKAIGIGLHDNALNAGLYELWRAGALDLRLSTTDESLTSIASTLLEADEVEMNMNFLLPPVLAATPDGLVLQFGEVVTDLRTPNGILGEAASFAMHGTMAVDAQFGEGELTLDFEDIEAAAIVRENDWGMDTLEASAAFGERLPLEMALSMMGGLSIAMPDLSELGLTQVEVSRSGETPETVLSLQ